MGHQVADINKLGGSLLSRFPSIARPDKKASKSQIMFHLDDKTPVVAKHIWEVC